MSSPNSQEWRDVKASNDGRIIFVGTRIMSEFIKISIYQQNLHLCAYAPSPSVPKTTAAQSTITSTIDTPLNVLTDPLVPELGVLEADDDVVDEPPAGAVTELDPDALVVLDAPPPPPPPPIDVEDFIELDDTLPSPPITSPLGLH